jgi:hypothetical protein
MISIQKNAQIKLDIPRFLCDDNAVGEHLNYHPVLKLLNVYGFLCIIGRAGQGKTSLAISLITQKSPKIYRKTHEHVIIVMPENSINSLKDNKFKVLPKDNIYDDLNDETILQIYDRIDGYSKKNQKTILFIDDQTASLKKSQIIMETLKRIVYNRRHLKTNIIITAQSYGNIPLDIRKNINNLVIFKPSKKEMQLLFDENIETKKGLFLHVMNVTYDEPRNFLFVNVPSQRLFKNFDELIIHEEDEDMTDNIKVL